MIIWKYTLKVTDTQSFRIPKGSKILTVQTQNDIPCIWVLVDQKEELTEVRTIGIHGTGNPIPDNPGIYIGTFQIRYGQLVFHVFDETNTLFQ